MKLTPIKTRIGNRKEKKNAESLKLIWEKLNLSWKRRELRYSIELAKYDHVFLYIVHEKEGSSYN